MAGRLCGALRLLEEGKEGIVVAEPDLWAELERVRQKLEAEAGGSGRVRKPNRYEAGVKRVRSLMYAAVSSGFVLAAHQGWLVNEGRHSSGQASIPDVQVLAFKHDQYRCYGGYLSYGSKRTFVCIEADNAKKQNKADYALLERVAKRLGALMADAAKTPLKTDEEWPVRVAAAAAPPGH